MATAPSARWRVRATTLDGVRLVEMPDLLPGALRLGCVGDGAAAGVAAGPAV